MLYWLALCALVIETTFWKEQDEEEQLIIQRRLLGPSDSSGSDGLAANRGGYSGDSSSSGSRGLLVSNSFGFLLFLYKHQKQFVLRPQITGNECLIPSTGDSIHEARDEVMIQNQDRLNGAKVDMVMKDAAE
eukprot:819363_1